MPPSLGLDITVNPFIFGRPVPPEKCVGRQAVARRVLSRLLAGGSSAIHGERRVGKTSFLLYLKAVGENSRATKDKLRFGYLDAQAIGYSGGDPKEFARLFWQTAIHVLSENETLRPHLASPQGDSKDDSLPTAATLANRFDKIGQQGDLAVLLLDEFEHVLDHVDPNEPALLHNLRNLASTTAGLALVIASREPMPKVLEKINLGHGSPFQNIFLLEEVTEFDEQTAKDLITTYLQETNSTFSFTPEELTSILQFAQDGDPPCYNPEKIQYAAWDVYERKLSA